MFKPDQALGQTVEIRIQAPPQHLKTANGFRRIQLTLIRSHQPSNQVSTFSRWAAVANAQFIGDMISNGWVTVESMARHDKSEDLTMVTPVVVDFPLRGEWITPNTPGTKVPSHGTDLFGERFAYDFVGVDQKSRSTRFYRPNPLHYLILGVRLQDCFGWGQPIFSATPGIVIRAEDGWPERNPVHLARDLPVLFENARSVNLKQAVDLRSLSGNFMIIESSDGYTVYAHAQTGSIRVSPGDKVIPGQWLANVGHSGNSTAPHLHFHIMDHHDPWKAQGIPCCFRDYEVFHKGVWRLAQNGIPKATDRIRKR